MIKKEKKENKIIIKKKEKEKATLLCIHINNISDFFYLNVFRISICLKWITDIFCNEAFLFVFIYIYIYFLFLGINLNIEVS
ncbi:hypothetical protein PFAG_05207 [Plasmodium falciparum Santa Lucia]|uniref:Uncharacterized protein n=4 Tax=Plasmodium falciparum TaxID=5833 RepID=A0A024W0S4_PLAFA|nr:hypothetical protein PFTANZ_05096 [Plasmodium falciparum Tanzania (2000708)]ETW40293.1 hypothetical protein PFNF135_05335 [Plasmodium falciparum NF135/5.C10]ETW58920.1 hypothetical protein PFMC_05105 [Plasmodium falciparum CAMP/Malaysia]EUT78632.1 hypothetical protein PFAG_05207 [Plasmodium falciparum Santa Lucia]